MRDIHPIVKTAMILTLLLPTLLAGCHREPSAEALRRVRTVRWQGTIEAFMRRSRGTATLTLPRGPHSRRRAGMARWRRRVRRGAGTASWGDGFSVPTPGSSHGAAGGPLRGHSERAGKGDGGKWPVLHLEQTGGPPMDVTVDPQTGLIAQVAGAFQIQGQTAKLEVDYGDYHQVEGVKLPGRIVNYAGRMKIGQTHFSQVEINVPVSDRTFRPEVDVKSAGRPPGTRG